MAEWDDKSEGFKLFVLRLLCENNTGDTFSGPFGGWEKERGIKVDQKEETHGTDRLFPVPPHQRTRDYHFFLCVMYYDPNSPTVFTALEKNTRALLFLVHDSSYRERRLVSFFSFATYIFRASDLRDQEKGGWLSRVLAEDYHDLWMSLAPDMLCSSQELTSIGSVTYNDKGILDPKMIKDLSLGFIYLVLGCDIKTNLKRKTTICSFLYLSTIQTPLCRGGGVGGVVYVLNRTRTKRVLLEGLRYFTHWQCNIPYTGISSRLIRIFCCTFHWISLFTVTGCGHRHPMCHCPGKGRLGTLESQNLGHAVGGSVGLPFSFPLLSSCPPMSSLSSPFFAVQDHILGWK